MEKKIPFSGDLKEKSYLLGLRTGDLHARSHYQKVQVEMTSTKQEQLKMFRTIFEKYAKVKSYEKKGGYTDKTNKIYSFLDKSFNFLVKKPSSIPDWIIEDKELFFFFLAGYCDSESSWIMTQHKKYGGKYRDLIFSLGTCDKRVLEQIHKKLKELGFSSHLYMVRKKGIYGERVCNLNLYRVMMANRKSVIKLAETLLPISKHGDKINAKRRLIDYNNKNLKTKAMNRKKLGTVQLDCPRCEHKKVWKNGIKRHEEYISLRFKCPLCKNEFVGGYEECRQ
jgi:DNA-directed RNA polymerase subunit M/transcription elongation factor TFIIS